MKSIVSSKNPFAGLQKVRALTLCVLCALFFLAVSCIKREPDAPLVSNVSFTPCQQAKIKSAENSYLVEVEFTGEGVKITYYDFEVTCDFTVVNATHTFVNGVLSITQQSSPSRADCVCYTDVSYTIEGISQEEVNVIFNDGEQVYCYNGSGQEIEATIIGKWKLEKIVQIRMIDGVLQEWDFIDDDVVFEFKSNNILVVSGNHFDEYPEIGEHHYKIQNEDELFINNGVIWWYKASHKSMSFTRLPLDGPTYYFSRIYLYESVF